MRPYAALFLLIVGAACGRTGKAPAQRPNSSKAAPAVVQATYVDEDADNLLDLSRGASILYRTSELNLEESAVHAIDGMATTRWVSPLYGAGQTLIASLPTAARVGQLGVVTSRAPAVIPEGVRFEASLDAKNWREVLVLKPADKEGRQVQDVDPFDAQYFRVSTVEPKESMSALRSLIVTGRALAAPNIPSFDGCWSVNGSQSRLVQKGRLLSGVIDGERATALDGAVDGSVARLMWVRGPMWGYAAVTIAPDARTISGLTFHQDILIGNAGAAWFGARCDAPLQIDPAAPLTFLRRSGRWSMFGLVFDSNGTLDREASAATIERAVATITASPAEQRFRIVSREYREPNAQRNREASAKRLASLREDFVRRGADLSRIEFIASGSESDSIESTFAVMRLLASRIDLEIVQ